MKNLTIREIMSDDINEIEKLMDIQLTYTEVPGGDDVREAISTLYSNVKMQDIMLYIGKEEALFTVFNTVLKFADQVICINPFSNVSKMLEEIGCEVIVLENGVNENVERLLSLCENMSPKMIFLSNIDDSYFEDSVMEKITVAVQKTEAMLVVDESGRKLTPGVKKASYVSGMDQGVVISDLNAGYSLENIGVAWAVVKDKKFLRLLGRYKHYTTCCGNPVSEYLVQKVINNKKYMIGGKKHG